ncbi:MAG: hypothetical protein KDK91_02465 [Gammaproteobacteria bacterium]|nr:hypothetical protein [Gammaproteobacteria bacterium]
MLSTSDTTVVDVNSFAQIRSNVRLAYTGWFAVVAISVSALALTNLLFRYWEVGASAMFSLILTWYRQIAHALLGYLSMLLSLHLSPTAKDLLTLWLMLGGLVARTLDYVYRRGHPFDHPPDVIGVLLLDRLATDYRVGRALTLVAATAFAWPYFVLRFARRPYLMTAGGLALYISNDRRTRSSFTYDTLEFDSRLIFLVYLATLSLACVTFFALNAMLPSVA